MALVVTSCPAEEVPPPQAPLRLDTVLSEGEVRCGAVTRSTELIGGPGAYGQVGRSYRCHNARIRFLLQDGSRPVGNSSIGGSIIDVDRVRADEESDGRDSFRELVVAFGANEVEVESIDVVNDGRNGEPGVLRVSGRPTPITMVPQAYYLRQDMPARVETDYILRPDTDHVEIRTRVINESEDFIGPLLYADFVTFGGEGAVHSPDLGFGSLDLFERAAYLGVKGNDDVSYGYVCSDNDITVPLADGSISAPVCRDDRQVGLEESYSRFLLVGDGSIESVARQAWQLRGLPTGTVSGVVKTGDGATAARVWVSAVTAGGLDAEGARLINQARTDDEGRYTLTLRPGSYEVVAHREGAAREGSLPVSVAEGASLEQDLTLGGEGRVLVTTTFQDAGGAALGPLPAKLSVLPLEDTQRTSATLDEYRRAGLVRYRPSADGTFDEPLPPGRYRVYVTRGFEHTRFEQDIEVTAGAVVEVEATLTHVLDTTGLIGAEFHQHTLASVDANVPLPLKVLENASEGVELTASTDHDNIADFGPYVEALGLTEHLVALAGNEVSYTAIGHFNVYPWDIDPQDPYRDVGSRVWWKKTVPEVFDDARALAGDPIVQINHPRSVGAGYFTSLLLNPKTGTRGAREPPTLPALPATIYDEWTSAFDAIEVNGNFGAAEQFTEEGWEALGELALTDPHSLPVLADWFGLMGSGLHVAAMGNSDTHRPDSGVGFPRNYLRVGKDAPATVTVDDVRDAIRNQRVSVGNGCLIEWHVGQTRPMGVGEAVAPASLSDLRLRVQVPPHAALNHVELYVNGRAQTLTLEDNALVIDAAGALKANVPGPAADGSATRLDVPVIGVPSGDVVVVALARGGSGLEPTGGGGTFCYSAPLYVDEGGDGWRGWLEDTTTLKAE